MKCTAVVLLSEVHNQQNILLFKEFRQFLQKTTKATKSAKQENMGLLGS